ncbi:MAG: hypothetical protein OXC44_01505 [Proteobacteria bacterium]|nr:hypothetical protein [Pseudomonadota bacterium]
MIDRYLFPQFHRVLMLVLLCVGCSTDTAHQETSKETSHLHGVAGGDGYVLRLKNLPTELKPKHPRPTHLRYVLNIPTSHFESFFIFELCKSGLQNPTFLDESSCFNPFMTTSGPLVLNQHNINDVFDLPRRLGIVVEDITTRLAPMVYFVMDHQVESFLGVSAVVAGSWLGANHVMDRYNRAQKLALRFSRSHQHLIHPQLLPSIKAAHELQPTPALTAAMKKSPHYVTKGGTMKRAVKMLELRLLTEKILSVSGKMFSTAVFTAGAMVVGYFVLPENARQFVRQTTTKGAKAILSKAKKSADHMLFFALENNSFTSFAPLERHTLQKMALGLNESPVFTPKQDHLITSMVSLPFSVLELIPALYDMMLSKRMSLKIDLTSYCLPSLLEGEKQCHSLL